MTAKTRSRRLRKKLHLGEFQELGFNVAIELGKRLDADTILDKWILEAIENNNMAFGGGASEDIIRGFVTKKGHGSLTEEHREILNNWLSSRPEIKNFDIGPLVDSWRDEPDQ